MLAGDLSIISLVEEIKGGNILLPMIQRPFVWLNDEERITKLFDSIIKKFPIGIFLFYQKSPIDNTQISARKFCDHIDKDTKFENYNVEVKDGQILVLDGHQRLQSLYLGVRNGSFYGKKLYYDVLFFEKKREISDTAFKFLKREEEIVYEKYDNDEEVLYFRFDKILNIAQKISAIAPYREKEEKEGILQELKGLVDQALGGLVDSGNKLEDIYNHIQKYIALSVFFIPDSNVFKYQLITNKKFEEDVLEIFVRFNQGGLPLTKSDLIFSTLKLEWRDVGRLFEELERETGINKGMLLKTLIVISDLPAGSKISEVRNKIDSLRDNYDKFEKIIEGFHDKIGKITELPWLIYQKFNFIIPVVYYFYRHPEKLASNELTLLPDVLKYILIIVYNSNLRSDNHLNKIIEIIRNEQSVDFPFSKIEEYLKQTGTKTELDGDSLNTNPILTFSLIQRNNWKPLSRNNRLNVDHIYPLAKKGELPIELQPLVDSIFNKYVVFEGDNIRKSATLPHEYFTGDKESYIKKYILPKEYLSDFQEMIEWRKKEIKNLFKEHLRIDLNV